MNTSDARRAPVEESLVSKIEEMSHIPPKLIRAHLMSDSGADFLKRIKSEAKLNLAIVMALLGSGGNLGALQIPLLKVLENRSVAEGVLKAFEDANRDILNDIFNTSNDEYEPPEIASGRITNQDMDIIEPKNLVKSQDGKKQQLRPVPKYAGTEPKRDDDPVHQDSEDNVA